MDTSGEEPVSVDAPFLLGSDDREEPTRIIGGDYYDYAFKESQTLLTSNKITINSRKNNSTISSKVDTLIGSGNETILISENATVVVSKKWLQEIGISVEPTTPKPQKINEAIEEEEKIQFTIHND